MTSSRENNLPDALGYHGLIEGQRRPVARGSFYIFYPVVLYMFYWVRWLCNNINVNLLYLEVQAGSPCILVGVNAP